MSIKSLISFVEELRQQGTKVEELTLLEVKESLKLYNLLKKESLLEHL